MRRGQLDLGGLARANLLQTATELARERLWFNRAERNVKAGQVAEPVSIGTGALNTHSMVWVRTRITLDGKVPAVVLLTV